MFYPPLYNPRMKKASERNGGFFRAVPGKISAFFPYLFTNSLHLGHTGFTRLLYDKTIRTKPDWKYKSSSLKNLFFFINPLFWFYPLFYNLKTKRPPSGREAFFVDFCPKCRFFLRYCSRKLHTRVIPDSHGCCIIRSSEEKLIKNKILFFEKPLLLFWKTLFRFYPLFYNPWMKKASERNGGFFRGNRQLP